MTSIHRSRKALLGLAAFASVAAVLPFANNAQAGLAPNAPPAGVATLSPASGTNANNFSIGLPLDGDGSGAKCPGDGVNGYRWGTYITPIGVDVASIVFDGTGSPTGPAVTSSLRNPSGTFIRAQIPGTGDGLINQPAAGYSWIGLTPPGTVLPAGAYNIGIACTLNEGTVLNQKFWNTQITVTSTGATSFSYSTGVVPSAPVLTTSSYNSGTATATVNFTHAASLPATTGYTATVSGVPGPIAVPAGATSFGFPLALGSSATVTLVATNATGNSAPSNSLTVVGAATTPPPVVTALDVFDGDDVVVNWTAPAGPVAPASYDVVIRDSASATVASQLAVVGLTATFAALPQASGYTASVTPNYPAGSGVVGQTGVDGFSVNPGALIVQELTVTRPAGALILTQRCGVYGALPTYGPADQFPGFPFALPDLPASADTIGTSPDIDLVSPGVQVDPEFGNYPLPNPPSGPALYPTECGLDMGTAQFITQGNLAGQFFAASGRLNQVTVLDTRDGDAGWTLRGDIEDRFTSISNGDSFSGDYLGWQPVMTDDSDEVGGEAPNGSAVVIDEVTGLPVLDGAGNTIPAALYDQTVTAAADILPGTGFSQLVGGVPAIGLTDNPVLASAPVRSGLGIATLDARLGLLIPTSVDAADYTATLTLTVA